MRSSTQLSTLSLSNDRVSTIGTRTGVARRQNHLTDLVRWLAAITLLVVAGFTGQTRAATDIRTAKEPVIVSLPLPSAQGLLGATEDRRAQMAQNLAVLVAETIDENPGRLVTIDPGRGKLVFYTLPAQEQAVAFVLNGDDTPALYEQALAQLLDATFEALTATHPKAPVSVLGLPLEARRWLPASIQESNDRYQAVIDRLAAFVSTRSFILFGSRITEQHTVQRGLPEAFRLRDDRPIIFRTNDYWRILLGGSTDISDFYADGWHVVDSDEQDGESSADDELALNEVAEDQEDSDNLAEATEDAVLQHDPFADPSDEDSFDVAGVPSLLAPGIGGGGGGRARPGGRSGGGGGGGSGGGGGGGLSFDPTQSESGSSGSGSNTDTGSSGSSSDSGSGGSGSSGGSGGSGGSGSSGGSGGSGGSGSSGGSGGSGGDSWNPDDEFKGDPDDDPPGFDDGDVYIVNDPPQDGAPFITGGNGWSGPTNEPGPIGNPDDRGYDAKAIARWDVVPYQTFDGDFEIGVVAFHMNGIDRVEFAADGGSWTPVSEMTLNPRTNVWEYWAVLDAHDFDDGPVEVRAIAYPKDAGEPRVLDGAIASVSLDQEDELTPARKGEWSLILNANAGASLPTQSRYASVTGSDDTGDGTPANPYLTIRKAARAIHDAQGDDAGGGTVLLMAGDYTLAAGSAGDPTTTTRFLTITRDPNAARESVRIVSTGGRLSTKLLRVFDLTINALIKTDPTDPGACVWLDQCYCDGLDTAGGPQFARHDYAHGGVYATGCTFTQTQDVNKLWVLMRDCETSFIGTDCNRQTFMIVNCVIHDLTDVGESHGDAWSSSGRHDNIIVYGFTVIDNITEQVLFARRGLPRDPDSFMNNVAFVNCLLRTTGNVGQWQRNSNHLLFWHFSHLGREFLFRDDSDVENNGCYSVLTNLDIRGSIFKDLRFQNATDPLEEESNEFVHDHFREGDTYGEDYSSGDPLFVDEGNLDFRPGASSPLKGRVDPLYVPIDAASVPLVVPASTGPLQHSD